MKIYEKLGPGHIFQSVRTGDGPKYTIEYSNYYNKVPADQLSLIRFYNMCENTEIVAHSNFKVCDFGYGNGSFLKTCNLKGLKTYGFDVSDYPVPEETVRLNSVEDIDVDVVTFFDSLEHISERNLIPLLKNLKTKFVVISLPWYHEALGEECFMSWKHRKENEHFHHFDVVGICNLLATSGYTILNISNCEDIIRKSVNNYPNILTVIAKKL